MMRSTLKHLPYLLLFLNAFWVEVNYAIVKYASWDKTPGFRTFKVVFLAVSLLIIGGYVWQKRADLPWGKLSVLAGILFFSAWSAGVVGFSDSSAWARYLTFSVPLIYILMTLLILIGRDGRQVVFERLLAIFLLLFLLPVGGYLLFERPFFSPYLSPTSILFKHNHYGWISIMYLVLSFDILCNRVSQTWQRWLIGGLVPVAYYIFLASGNRATWLSGGITLAVVLFRSVQMSQRWKGFLLTACLLPLYYFAVTPNSSFYAAWERTDAQLTYGTLTSERLLWAKAAFADLITHPVQWLIGRGMFNYTGLINPHSYHNSYYEILFGCGIPVFLLFTYAMIWKPFWHYWKGYSKRYLTFFPLLIIPFFESNLTGGQFLFYPWFTFTIFYYLSPSAEGADQAVL